MPEWPRPLRVQGHAHTEAQGVSYGISPSSSCPPQQWCPACPAGLDLLLGCLCHGVSLLSPWHTTPPPIVHCSLAPQAVPTQPAPVLSLGLSSRAWVSAPSPCLSISGCDAWAGGSDDLCSSHSALLFSVQLLHFSRQLWGPTDLADLSSVRWLPRRWVPFLLHSSLSGMLVPSWFLFSLFFSFVLPSYVKSFLSFLEV